MLLLRLSQGILSWYYHATLTSFFWNCLYFGKGIMLLLRLFECISSGCQHATLTPFFVIVISVGKGHYSFRST